MFPGRRNWESIADNNPEDKRNYGLTAPPDAVKNEFRLSAGYS